MEWWSETKVCEFCGQSFGPNRRYGLAAWQRRRFCGHPCANRQKAEANARAAIRPPQVCDYGEQTYRKLWCIERRRYIFEHRLVMEAELGRRLLSSEVVHHRNHDGLDNRLENLELMTRGEHRRLHIAEDVASGMRGVQRVGVPGPRPHLRKPKRPCAWCGQPIKQGAARVKCCSFSCGQKLRYAKERGDQLPLAS